MENVLFTRQPVFDRALKVFGYELLYQDAGFAERQFDDERVSAARTILSTFLEVGADRVVGSSMIFLDIPRAFVFDEELIPMFEGQSILELPAGMQDSVKVISGIERLRLAGYYLALDAFTGTDAQMNLVEHMDYVKIDMSSMEPADVSDLLTILQTLSCKTLAYHVDSHSLADTCLELGFDYLQGDFLSEPQAIESGVLGSNKTVMLELVRKLMEPDRSIDDIAKTLALDVAMTYKLLRYINSASFPNRSQVDTIQDALMLVGVDAVRNWASMVVISEMSTETSEEMVITALVRARMCEQIGLQNSKRMASQMFVVGLFSLLDTLLHRPMVDILDELSLMPEIRFALLDYEGEHGRILQQVMLFEKGKWDELADSAFDEKLFARLYPQALRWATSAWAELKYTEAA